MDGRQPVVACLDSILSLALQVLQKAADGLGGNVLQPERGRGFPVMFAGEREEQFPGIPVGKDGVLAQAPCRDKVMLEEAADRFGKVGLGHGFWFRTTGGTAIAHGGRGADGADEAFALVADSCGGTDEPQQLRYGIATVQ